MLRLHHARRRRGAAYPCQVQGLDSLGVIADLQCGGWSTTLLTAKGALYTLGVLDGLKWDQANQQVRDTPTPLRFPPGFPQPQERHYPATAVKQFSSGRAHVLALSDSGRIWSWHHRDLPSVHVKFVNHETRETGGEQGEGTVKKVVAGWNKSSALVNGTGIVLWEPLQLSREEIDVADAALVLETQVVPRTGTRHVDDETDTIGEVLNFTLLEDTIIFNTSLGKVFAALISWTAESQTVHEPVELAIPLAEGAAPDASWVTDVQGSFRSFAVFTKAGAVLTSTQDAIMPLVQGHDGDWHPFKRIPALQNQQVISLAFGDYHFHALHAPGYITSWGVEPNSCGALGIGGNGAPEGRLRGVRNQAANGDGRLVPHAYTAGRRIWFEEEKRKWAQFLTSGGVDQEEAAERLRMAIGSPDVAAQGEVSEWIEQEGRDWESKFNIKDKNGEDDGLGAYFALNVTAAGWHSAALVLVNESMANELRNAVEIPDHVGATEEAGAGPSNAAETPAPAQDGNSERTRTWTDTAVDFGRYFLGLAPYNVNSAAYDPNAPHLRHAPTATSAQHNVAPRLSYGASPREGFHYVWANDHFPRLRLSNGTDMPGEVEFDEWRYGRPEWKLDWDHQD